MDQQTIRVDHVGDEGEPVVVIDGFAPDPDALIDAAAGLRFAPMGEYYPGVRAPVTPLYFQAVGQTVAAVVRQVFGARDRLDVNRALYSLTTTVPADLSLAQRIPHIDDVAEGRIAIIHYLSRRDLGGTAFFRHVSTGYETVTPDRHRPYLDALRRDFERHGEPDPAYIDGDTAIFTRIAAHEGVFNRALVYRSRLLHCARLSDVGSLAADPRTGRLTIASFLTVA